MATKKVSSLPLAAALTGPEKWHIVQGGVDFYVTPDLIVAFLASAGVKTPGKFRRTGTYETQAYTAGAAGNYTMGQDSLRAFPWLIQDAITIVEIKTRVVTNQASAKYRVGIYTNTAGTNYPASLVAGSDVMEYDAATGGTKASTAISITLQPGLYWVATNSNNGSVVLDGFTSASSVPITLTDITAGVFSPNRWLVATTYGAMPSTFTAAAALASSGYPLVGFKI